MNRFLTAIATVILIMVFAFSCKKSDTANDGGSSGGLVEPQHYSISVLASPADGGIVTGGGDFEEGQTCTVTASPDFVYVFTNWTENDTVVSDSVSYTFEVTCNRNLVANFALPTYVDLGLPSGTLWASCNLGANTPDGYGEYFAWGETEPKSYYDCDNYRYCHGCEVDDEMNYISMTKYCPDSYYGYNGFTDDLTILLPDDDAATVNMGEGWRIPTNEEWEELMNNTSLSFYTTSNEVNGLLLTATNGAKLFLPAAGFISNMLWYAGSRGSYLTKALDNDAPYNAWDLLFSSEGARMASGLRFLGQSVKAVRSER